MSIEKLIRKLLTDQTHITENDCIRLLNYYGYTLHKSGGSHRGFHKKGAISITVVIPKGTKYIKSPYVQEISRILKLEG
jgi:predicted RNA binding protein YcfA (HicA-like mRNA interferase family)